VLLVNRANAPPHSADLRSGHRRQIASFKNNGGRVSPNRRIQKAKQSGLPRARVASSAMCSPPSLAGKPVQGAHARVSLYVDFAYGIKRVDHFMSPASFAACRSLP